VPSRQIDVKAMVNLVMGLWIRALALIHRIGWDSTSSLLPGVGVLLHRHRLCRIGVPSRMGRRGNCLLIQLLLSVHLWNRLSCRIGKGPSRLANSRLLATAFGRGIHMGMSWRTWYPTRLCQGGSELYMISAAIHAAMREVAICGICECWSLVSAAPNQRNRSLFQLGSRYDIQGPHRARVPLLDLRPLEDRLRLLPLFLSWHLRAA